METTMFTLGILSIISAASVALVIYGTVRVLKLKTETTEIWRQLHENFNMLHRSVEELSREVNLNAERMRTEVNSDLSAFEQDVNRQFEATSRDINIIEATMKNGIKQVETNTWQNSKSYTDSRIDKLVDTYFEVQSIKKQILKD